MDAKAFEELRKVIDGIGDEREAIGKDPHPVGSD